ncbi:hypothetical protein DENIS_1972 [Desulfonema ishimotonii]|uniref:Serine protease n=1 Tax=Desulfonema ishimotonii TaxID=45657 RepID=A0A401FVK7_9BACT|nr:serine protease [Desulfonema ishimotonii]GBC61012.1 hypothetical protein DENIS_1972 [Desulfonema ishimotonii]
MFKQDLTGEYLEISNIQKDEQDSVLAKDNVVGVGIGHKTTDEKETGDVCMTVLVAQKLDASLLKIDDMIPPTIGKFKTDVIETGEIFAGTHHDTEDVALTEEENVGAQILAKRLRPVKGGYSVGHYKITAGTMATAVYDAKPYPGIPSKYYMLSNNHVLANSNNARIGDPILQPGPYDGGKRRKDRIARLSRFVPIRFNGPCNYVDAAIAEGQFHDLNREIYWIGYVKGVGAVKVGTIVQKTGRTTNYTTGKVVALNGTVNVNYGSGQVAKMCRQIITTNMSAGGDSGSLLCDLNENAVGLLFAGSSTVTIHNDIRYVQSLLNIRIV